MGEWREVKVGDIANLYQGLAINKKTDYLLVEKSTLPLLRIKDLQDNGEEFFVNDKEAPKKCIANEDDLIFTRTGIVGMVFMGKRGVVHNNCFRIVPRTDEMYLPFYYHYFNRESMRDYLTNISAGSVQPDMNHTIFKAVQVPFPPLKEQKAIAEVLSSLDDKIDLLHRQNKTLEELAQTLFRQWFIEEAKDEWEAGTLEDIMQFNPSHSLKKGELCPFLEMGNVQTFQSSVANWYKREYTSGTKFKKGDTLLARITPSLENGKTAYVDFLKDDEIGWGSTEFIVMRMKEDYHPFISYLIARNQDFRDFAIGNMTGSTGRQRAQAKDIKEYEILIPSTDIIKKLNEAIAPIPIKIKANSKQIKTLENMRDTLLPKLMSGEVRVYI